MTSATILASLLRYLGGGTPVEAFEHGLPDGWELDEANDADLRSLVMQIMGYLGEYTRGDIDEGVLRQRLAPLAAWVAATEIIVAEPTEPKRPAWVPSTATGPFSVAGIQLAEAHG